MHNLINALDDGWQKPLIYRLKHGGGHKTQAIAKAVGTSSKKKLLVIDATCGFAIDAIVLAYFNCEVYTIEKNPSIATIANHKLQQAQNNPFLARIIKNINFFMGDALEIIPQIINKIGHLPDVIYLDPMFNEVHKITAAANKSIQLLRSIINANHNPEQLDKIEQENNRLLYFSLKYATKRIVVKRAKHAKNLSNLKPHFVLTGKANRFDVYLPHQYSLPKHTPKTNCTAT
jgi:16S rRNA (guanine1516-N2)-methyltransferase